MTRTEIKGRMLNRLSHRGTPKMPSLKLCVLKLPLSRAWTRKLERRLILWAGGTHNWLCGLWGLA